MATLGAMDVAASGGRYALRAGLQALGDWCLEGLLAGRCLLPASLQGKDWAEPVRGRVQMNRADYVWERSINVCLDSASLVLFAKSNWLPASCVELQFHCLMFIALQTF